MSYQEVAEAGAVYAAKIMALEADNGRMVQTNADLATEVEVLLTRIHNAVEVFANMEGIPMPVNAREAYLLRTLEQIICVLAGGE